MSTSARRNRSDATRWWLGSVLRLIASAIAVAPLASCATVNGHDDSGVEQATLMIARLSDDAAADMHELEGQTLAGAIDVVVETAGAIRQVLFYVDDAAEPTAVADSAPFSFELDTLALSDGEHKLTARVPIGGPGDTGILATAVFQVSNLAPETGLEEPADDEAPDEDAGLDPGEDGEETPEVVESDPVVVESDPEVVEPAPEVVEPDLRQPSGPIVITEGGTYSGWWQSLDSEVPAVEIRTREPVVIENSVIRSAGHLIRAPVSDVHLTVRNVYGEALYPTSVGRSAGRFVVVEGYRHLAVENSALVGTSGILASRSAVGATFRVVRNRVLNIDGRRSDGEGAYSGFSIVQFVQISNGRELRESEIAWNEVVNEPFHSRVEDVINLYKTSGTASSPIRIHHNYIEGAYPLDPLRERFSGGGILLGDDGGSHQHTYRNHVVATTNYGIAIAGGHHNRVEANRVVACGKLPDGSPIAAQNVGVYIWNQYGSPFYENVGRNNVVAWVQAGGGREDWWVPDASEWSGNTSLGLGADVACAMEEDERVNWEAKVAAEGIEIGPTSGAAQMLANTMLD